VTDPDYLIAAEMIDGSTMRVIVFDVDPATGCKSVHDILEFCKASSWHSPVETMSKRLAKRFENFDFIDHLKAETKFGRVRTDHGRIRKFLWQVQYRWHRDMVKDMNERIAT